MTFQVCFDSYLLTFQVWSGTGTVILIFWSGSLFLEKYVKIYFLVKKCTICHEFMNCLYPEWPEKLDPYPKLIISDPQHRYEDLIGNIGVKNSY